MFSGNEWVILVILVGVLALPVVIIVAIVLGTRGRRTTTTHAASGAMPTPTQQSSVAGWFPDPAGRHDQRYWDGSTWTDAVVSNGQPGTDPL
jgi:hypothetical protein